MQEETSVENIIPYRVRPEGPRRTLVQGTVRKHPLRLEIIRSLPNLLWSLDGDLDLALEPSQTSP